MVIGDHGCGVRGNGPVQSPVSLCVTVVAEQDQVGVHVPPALGPGKDVVQLGGVKGQRDPAIPTNAASLLEETEPLLAPPLPLVEAGEVATGALTGHGVLDHRGGTWGLGRL